MLVDEPLRIRFDVLHFACRRNAWHDTCGQTAGLFAIQTGLLTTSKRAEPVIKLALKSIQKLRIERCEALLSDKLIKPVLPFDQELQPPYAVFHIEGKEIIPPRRTSVSSLYFESQTLAVRVLVDDLLADSSGIDDFCHHARERRERRYPSQLEDQLGAESAHGSKLEANIGLIGKACIGGDMGIHLLPPDAQVLSRNGAIKRDADKFAYELADMRASGFDDCSQPPHLIVEFAHAGKFFRNGLCARDVRQCGPQGGKEARNLLAPVGQRRSRVRIDIDETPVHLAISRPAMNGRNRLLKRPIVEH